MGICAPEAHSFDRAVSRNVRLGIDKQKAPLPFFPRQRCLVCFLQ